MLCLRDLHSTVVPGYIANVFPLHTCVTKTPCTDCSSKSFRCPKGIVRHTIGAGGGPSPQFGCQLAQMFYCNFPAKASTDGHVVSFEFPDGCGSKFTRRSYAGFGPCFHFPGFHFGTGFLSHSHIPSEFKSPTIFGHAIL